MIEVSVTSPMPSHVCVLNTKHISLATPSKMDWTKEKLMC